jgi:predicted HTH domain antitoxin
VSEVDIALKAVQLYAEAHPRPSHVTHEQAAEMAGVSRGTISKMVSAGTIKLNGFGRIPVAEIDRVLRAV